MIHQSLFATILSIHMYHICGNIHVASFGVYSETNVPHNTSYTLWFKDVIYQCDLPSTNNAWTICDNKTWEITCINESSPDQYKLMIDNEHPYTIAAAKVRVNLTNGVFYGITSWCLYDFSNAGAHYLDLITNTTECGPNTVYATSIQVSWFRSQPARQLMYFDIAKPNEYITKALWEDGTDTIISSNHCEFPSIHPTNNPSTDPTSSPNNPSLHSFGIVTSTDNLSETLDTITLTLWYGSMIYQCSVNPINKGSHYGCNSGTWTVSSYTNYGCSIQPKIMIENPGSDAIYIEHVFIDLHNGTHYGIEGICIYPPYTNIVGDPR